MQELSPRTVSALVHRAIVATLLAAVALVVVGSGPAVSAEDGRVSWAIRTASNDFGAARQNYEYSLDPGGTLSDGLMVINHGKEDLALKVYAADGFTSESGQLDLRTAEEKPVGVGAWLKAGQGTVKVPAGKTVEVPFTITLPENATPGDHVGGIITSLATTTDGAGIEVDRRLAMRVKLRVGGELAPALAVEDLHVDHRGSANPFAQGVATIGYTVRNTGNAIVTAQQTASVSGPFGIFRARAGAIDDSPALLPGDTWKVEVPVDGVAPTVRVAATVTLKPLVTDASGTITPLDPVDATTHAWAVPWSALVLLVVLIALVVLALRVRRRRAAENEARVQAAVADALRERESV
jgi:cbb3-type cytochrome oxidase subunit 3